MNALDTYQEKHKLNDDFALWVCTMGIYQAKPTDLIEDIGPTVQQQVRSRVDNLCDGFSC